MIVVVVSKVKWVYRKVKQYLAQRKAKKRQKAALKAAAEEKRKLEEDFLVVASEIPIAPVTFSWRKEVRKSFKKVKDVAFFIAEG